MRPVDLKMFIDDVKLSLSCQTIEERAVLQANVNDYFDWSTDSQLAMQPAKSASLTIGKAPAAAYTLDGTALSAVSSIRDLGVIMDASLNFKQHIAAVCRKVLTDLIVLFKSVSCLSEIRMLCFAHISPLLDLCLSMLQ